MNENNQDNGRIRYDVTPMDESARSVRHDPTADTVSASADAAAEALRLRGEMTGLRRSLRRIVALCCVFSLLLGVGGGALITGLVRQDAAAGAPQAQSTGFTALPGDTIQPKTFYTVAGSDSEAMSTADVVAMMGDAVVSITVETQVQGGFYGQNYTATGAGSGVILSQDGYIVTNRHVIDGAQKINITLKNGTTYEAKLVGNDQVTDVALLKVEASGLHYALPGNSAALRAGDTAIVIGNPLGIFSGTVTQGVISGLDRALTMNDGTVMNLLQLDASVNPGNSGGALFNDRAELMGIVVAKTSATEVEGLGFAIPINDVLPILDELMENGYVTGRPALGIEVREVSNPMDAMMYRLSRLGVYVNRVADENSNPLRMGDCILALGDTEITTSAELRTALSGLSVGDTVKIKVLRDSEELTVEVKLVESGSVQYPAQAQEENAA